MASVEDHSSTKSTFTEAKKCGFILESDLRTERAEWLKTKLEGIDDTSSKCIWKIKCQSVYELIVLQFPTVTRVEAGKITKKAFPFLKKQTCHQRDGSHDKYYYRIRSRRSSESDTCGAVVQTNQTQAELHNQELIPQLEKNLMEKEKELALKDKQLKRLASSYSSSVKKIKCLEKQKTTLSTIVNELDENRLLERAGQGQHPLCEKIPDITGINHIPKDHLTPHYDGGKDIGSGSYGSCELMNWRNIKVCVKTLHVKTEKSDVKHEAATLKQLQQSLFVPILLGINIDTSPFYIVTKFHSATAESSVTLQKAIKKCSLGVHKWLSILYKCSLGVQSVHHQGFIHNDLHQKNIILDRLNGHVHPIIIDFGKACRIGSGRCRTVDNVDSYTKLHPWVAPETICGQEKESEESDVYSVGYIISKVNAIIQLGGLNDLIVKCQAKRSQRPTMESIIASLKSLYEQNQALQGTKPS